MVFIGINAASLGIHGVVSELSLAAKSFLIGFVTFFLPSSFFTLRSWRYTGAKYAQQMVQSFYLAEIGKFTLTFLCFALSFKLLQPINAGIVFVTYLCFFGLHQLLIAMALRQKA